MDVKITRINCLTGGHPTGAMLPLDYPTDRECLDAALPTIGLTEPPQARLLWVHNTLDVAEVECSVAYLNEARERSDLEIINDPRPLPLDAAGNLAGPGVSQLGVKLSLMITCLGDVIRPSAGKAVVRMLRRLGHAIDFPEAQTCCGQPMFNSGYADLAREQAKHTIRVFEGEQPVVVPSGSCAAMVKVEYPHLLEGDAEWHARAVDLAQRTFEFSDFLVNQLEGRRCRREVRRQGRVSLRLPPADAGADERSRNARAARRRARPMCRSTGRTSAAALAARSSIRYPQISGNMVEDKMQCILATGADCVVSTDAGCLMNIGGRLHREGQQVELLHIAELLERQ